MKSIHDKIILFSHEGGMVYKVATKLSESLKIPKVSSQTFPNLENYSLVIIVTSNYGDEELPPNLENYLIALRTRDKEYALCELGNYFGYESEYFGCKRIVQGILLRLGWMELSNISLDSFPELDLGSLDDWIMVLNEILSQN
jgi:flavodoxin